MLTLSNGYRLPETGDFGNDWFPALEDNIQRVNDHTHNGVNSNKIPSSGVVGISQPVASGDFIVQGGRFRATVVLAGGSVNVDDKSVIVRDPVTKNPIFLEIEKANPTTIHIYSEIARDFEVFLV